jgi:MoaA/NifB/PqqE/SkfB family radical SAM enzyme
MDLMYRVFKIARERGVPLKVHFDLTYRCHQRCLHCYIPEAWRQGRGSERELTTVQVKGILEQLAAAGTFFLTFSGGEIFLRPDLLEIVGYARDLNFSISLMTSGSWGIGKEQIRSLSELGIEGLLITMFSLDARVHDEITGLPGSWAKLQKTLKDCRSEGMRVTINCSAMTPNYQGVLGLKAMAQKEGIPVRLSTEISDRWDGKPHLEGLALDAQVRQTLWGSLLSGEEESIIVSPEYELGGCWAGVDSCYVGPGGEVWPCVGFPVKCGSLDQGDKFLSVWRDGPLFATVRRLQEEIADSDKVLCNYNERTLKEMCDENSS